MKIAVIGSGIAGISAAWALCRQHEVVLFEKENRLGGHTHTHDIAMDGKNYRIDSGFIVHNPENYPLFSAFLKELGVPTKTTEMSFAVHNRVLGMFYNAHDLGGLFCQRRNLVSPAFWRMLSEIRRFYAECPALLASDEDGPALGDYLHANGYSTFFIENHLIPMASALWSSPSQRILDFPAKYLVAFMANHHMLQITDRPLWRVLENGSSSYIEKISRVWPVTVRLDSPVRRVLRSDDAVAVTTDHATEHFDQVVFASHSDQTLMMLADADTREREILGAIRYQANETILHCDASVLPPDRRAWAAWNADIPSNPDAPCTVSYCMNILQGIESPEPFIVSLNQRNQIDPAKILAVMQYHHPVYDHAMVRAQFRQNEIQGKRRSWFCGAYWGFGFHEDGFRSGHEVAEGILAL
ncbi:NAD(P)/FAD-dependent oxidoreductase [Arenimonas sp.]|jgi:predicted NAD/FAD-binding protein|uniref:NAD(P)/FAD-dependent oxidoreductase n=1 Tax=Arenimonas sp. TaxID=1872635 RepID=UPI0037BEF5E3